MSDKNDLFELAKILSSQYSTFLSNEAVKRNILKAFDGRFPPDYIDGDLTPREFMNKFLMQYYPNETAIKSKFINQVLLKANNHVAIFELNVGQSRLDLCKINGNSTAFEIKTDFDTPKRLAQQMNDYFKVFEKVYLICSVNKLDKMLDYVPKECGIYTYYVTNNGKYVFKKNRAAVKSNCISSYAQLSVLTKKDLNFYFNCPHLAMKDDMINLIINRIQDNEINKIFKLCVKNKFQEKWDFLADNSSEILEIDYQWFYKNLLQPKIVYL